MFLGRRAHCGYKAVTFSNYGFDVSGLIGIVDQNVADLADRGIDSVLEVNEGVVGPQSVTQLLASDHFSFGFQQQAKYLQRLLLNSNRSASRLAQFTAGQIDLKPVEAGA